MWHSAALVLILAASLTAVEAMTRPDNWLGTMLTGLFPLAGAPVAWRLGPRFSPRMSYRMGWLFLLLGVASTGLSIYNWRGTPVSAAMGFHFVLAVVFAAAFNDERDVVGLLAVEAVAAAVALGADGLVVEELLIWLLMMLSLSGTGVVLARAMTTANRLSYGDPLTGAANRRAWDLAVAQVIAQHHRGHRPSSVLLIDIDYFKAVNDRAGHDGGDAVLRAAVLAWLRCTRPNDTLARLGGDEFGLLAVGVAHDEAMALGERLRAELCRLTDATCSVGVATAPPDAEPELLLATADAELYRAKEAGRNCVRGSMVPTGQPSATASSSRLRIPTRAA